MRYTIPDEQKRALGIRIRKPLTEIPAEMRKPIPIAEWVEDPHSFVKSQFIKETVQYIIDVYGADPESYQYQVLFLADSMQLLVDAEIGFLESGSKILVNRKLSPWLRVKDTAIEQIIRLSRELGLTPSSRLPRQTIQMQSKTIYDALPFMDKR